MLTGKRIIDNLELEKWNIVFTLFLMQKTQLVENPTKGGLRNAERRSYRTKRTRIQNRQRRG